MVWIDSPFRLRTAFISTKLWLRQNFLHNKTCKEGALLWQRVQNRNCWKQLANTFKVKWSHWNLVKLRKNRLDWSFWANDSLLSWLTATEKWFGAPTFEWVDSLQFTALVSYDQFLKEKSWVAILSGIQRRPISFCEYRSYREQGRALAVDCIQSPKYPTLRVLAETSKHFLQFLFGENNSRHAVKTIFSNM